MVWHGRKEGAGEHLILKRFEHVIEVLTATAVEKFVAQGESGPQYTMNIFCRFSMARQVHKQLVILA